MTRAAPTRPRLEAADALRAVATVFVIVIHTSHWPPQATLFDDLDLLSRFAVPAFMMLTGALLSYQYLDERPRVRAFVTRRFSRSLLPWLVWAPVYAATGWLLTGDVPHTLGDLATFFSYGAGHLWFLLLIPQMYLLYLVWPRRNLWAWAAAAVVVQTALAVYRLYGPMPVAALSQLTLWHGFQLLPFWVGYFAIGLAAGGTLARRGEPGRVPLRVTALAALATVGTGVLLVWLTYDGSPNPDFQHGTGGFLLPQQPLFVVSVALLVLLTGPTLLRRSRAVAATASVLSENSLGVYILHPLLIYLIGKQIMDRFLLPGLPVSFVGFLILTIGGLASATLASILLSATPMAATLGVTRRALRPGRQHTAGPGARGG